MDELNTKPDSGKHTNSATSIPNYKFKALDIEALSRSIGRKATDEELVDLFSKDAGPFIEIEEAFAKYRSYNDQNI